MLKKVMVTAVTLALLAGITLSTTGCYIYEYYIDYLCPGAPGGEVPPDLPPSDPGV